MPSSIVTFVPLCLCGAGFTPSPPAPLPLGGEQQEWALARPRNDTGGVPLARGRTATTSPNINRNGIHPTTILLMLQWEGSIAMRLPNADPR